MISNLGMQHAQQTKCQLHRYCQLHYDQKCELSMHVRTCMRGNINQIQIRTCTGLFGTNSFPTYAHDRGPSPQHQLQLVQLLPGGRPSLVVLPCFLLWTATAQKEGWGDPRNVITCSCSKRAHRTQTARTFSASSDLNASLVASEICSDITGPKFNEILMWVSSTPAAAHLWHIRVAGAFCHIDGCGLLGKNSNWGTHIN